MKLKRRHKKLLKLLVALVVVLAGFLTQQYPEQTGQVASSTTAGSFTVTEFLDGDTIAVNMNGTIERIRMIGVDTPETHDPRKAVECFGKVASEYTRQLIGDKPVRLEADSLSTNRDRYDRLLRYVYTADNKLVQAEVIKNGYGFAYTSFPFEKSEEFRAYESNAREQNLGLWSGCQPYLDKNGYIHSNEETNP